jgi:peptidoglycan/LPS O-acetylase OafA/YrhL
LKNVGEFAPRDLTPCASTHLDWVRALAAWAVMWGHVRGIFFVDIRQVPHAGFLLKGVYLLTGFGHQAVPVFFVLSGFLISSAILKRRASGTWSWRDCAIDRSSRLYVVLIPELLFGLVWDKAGSVWFASTGLYSHPLQAFGDAVAKNQMTLPIFLGNLFFLQTIVCPAFGSNGPLWSLANEF